MAISYVRWNPTLNMGANIDSVIALNRTWDVTLSLPRPTGVKDADRFLTRYAHAGHKYLQYHASRIFNKSFEEKH